MLGVLIPARNEEKNIEAVIKNILDCDISPDDIYVMDNNSSDQTRTIAEKLKVNVSLVENIGYHTALNEGMKLLIKKQYTKFCIIDGDNEIGRASIETAIIRSKTYEFNVGKRPKVERFGERIVNKVINHLYGIEDLMCGVKSGELTYYNNFNKLEYGIDLINLKDIPEQKISNFNINVNKRSESRLGNNFIVNIKLIINILKFLYLK